MAHLGKLLLYHPIRHPPLTRQYDDMHTVPVLVRHHAM